VGNEFVSGCPSACKGAEGGREKDVSVWSLSSGKGKDFQDKKLSSYSSFFSLNPRH